MSLQTVAAFPAHSSGMCDMDVVGNFLVTCGLSQQYVCVCVRTCEQWGHLWPVTTVCVCTCVCTYVRTCVLWETSVACCDDKHVRTYLGRVR